MHLAAHRKKRRSAFNRLVDLTEVMRDAALGDRTPPWRLGEEATSPFVSRSLEDLPHHDRVGLETFAIASEVVPSSAGVSDETHDWTALAITTVRGHNGNNISLH